MDNELKSLIEDAAKLLGIKKISFDQNGTPYHFVEVSPVNGHRAEFNPLDPERGDLWKVADAAKLSIELDASLVSADWDGNYTYRINEKIGGSDYQSQALAVLRAASAVLKAREGM